MSIPLPTLAYAVKDEVDQRAESGSSRFFWISLITAIATFPLIFMGGLVTSNHAGMSVPDWPNSYGYNMFLFPPSQWVGGILYEHTHRLMGTVVGFCATVLVLNAWGVGRNPATRKRLGQAAILFALASAVAFIAVKVGHAHFRPKVTAALQHSAVLLICLAIVLGASYRATLKEPRRWVRWVATAVLVVTILQGAIGGLRVVLIKLDLAIVHACLAQAFFCLAALMAVVTSKGWRTAPDLSAKAGGRGLGVLGIATVAMIYAQLMVGATMRHYDGGLAIPDLPLAYGKWLPPTNDAELADINHRRATLLSPDPKGWLAAHIPTASYLPPVTLTQVWLNYGHRMGALFVSLLVLLFAHQAFYRKDAAGLKAIAALLPLLLLLQLTLGVLTILLRKPADIASTHVAVGALVLVCTFVLTVRILRLYRVSTGRVPAAERSSPGSVSSSLLTT